MSSNVNIDQAFAGIEDATVEDRFPQVPANVRGKGRVSAVSVFESSKDAGLCFCAEFEVLESSNPATCVSGQTYAKVITKLNSPAKGTRALKMGNLVQLLGALFRKDPKDEKFLGQVKTLIGYCRDKGAANGKEFLFETSEATTEGGHKFVRMQFRPTE